MVADALSRQVITNNSAGNSIQVEAGSCAAISCPVPNWLEEIHQLYISETKLNAKV